MTEKYTREEVTKIAQEMVYLYTWFQPDWKAPGELDAWVKLRVELRLKNGPGQDTLTDTPAPILYPELRVKKKKSFIERLPDIRRII